MTEINNSETFAKCNQEIPLPATRSEALATGSKHYFTGVPCHRGHVEPRLTSSKACRACDCIWQSERRKRDPERYAEKDRRATAKHRDKILARVRADRLTDPEKYRSRLRAWYRENPDAGLALRHARKARKLGGGGKHTAADIARIYAEQNGLCRVCDIDLSITGKHRDHIVPLVAGGSNGAENIQLLCPTCNLRKGAKPFDQFFIEYISAGF